MLKLLKLLALIALLTACDKKTDVAISDAWVRPSAPGQTVGAAYMTLNSPQDSTLVYVESDVADAVEIHSMNVENGVMKMRMLDALKLKANTPEKLAPGGFHLMLLEIKKPLKEGENINFRLRFKDNTGNITDQNVTLLVKQAE